MPTNPADTYVVAPEPAAKVPDLKDFASGLTDPTAIALKGIQRAQESIDTTEADVTKVRAAKDADLEAIRKKQGDWTLKRDAMRKEYDAAADAYAAKAQQVPQQPGIAPPPSRGLAPYLSPMQGEDPATTVAKFMQTVSLFATMAGGGRTGARASLSAFTGMLQGWKEGNREKADREYGAWKDSTEAMLNQFDNEMRRYSSILIAERVPLDQKLRALELAARDQQNDMLADQLKIGEYDKSIAELDKRRSSAEKLIESFTKLLAMKEDKDRRLQDAKLFHLGLLDRKDEQIANTRESIKDRQGQREFMRELLGDQAAQHGKEYWVVSEGRMRPISKNEEIQDLQSAKSGQPTNFRPLDMQDRRLLDRLVVAVPIVQRLRTLIDRVAAEHPGENITTGLISKAAFKAGLSPDLQELASLNIDATLETTAAVSGGQPRITIMQMIRGEATPKFGMTKDVMIRAVDVMETTIGNRADSITKDPGTLAKLAKDLKPYTDPRPKMPDASEDNPLGLPGGPKR